METLLAASTDAARRGGVIQKASTQQVIVDTTVMPKAIAHPDSRLLDKSRQHLVKVAEDNGLRLRQNYNRVAPRLAAQIARYAHAKQFKCSHASMLPLHRPITRRVSALCCRDPVERISCQLHSGLVLPWMPQFLHKLIPQRHLEPGRWRIATVSSVTMVLSRPRCSPCPGST